MATRIPECHYCGSKTSDHAKCTYCKEHGKCWMCKFYDKDELTAAEREKIDAGPWRINRIRCKGCGDVITSNNRHDYKYCKCGAVFVDGGSWYLRRGGKLELIEEMNEKYADAK